MWRTIYSISCIFGATALCAQEKESPGALLDSLLPDAEQVAEFEKLVDELGAEEFRIRSRAMERLLRVPLIPDGVLRGGLESEEPEIRARVREIVRKGGRTKSEAVFRRALELLAEGNQKGQLDKVVEVLASGLTIDGRLAVAESASVRRMAAAGAESIGKQGMGVLRVLLGDAEDTVRMQAAVGLANLGEIAGARELAEFLDSESTAERTRAWEGLQALTGKAFGYSPLGPQGARQTSAQRWKEYLGGDVVLKGKVGQSRALALFNGRDLTGWTHYRKGRVVEPDEDTWSVEDGILHCPGGGPGDLRTDADFEDYVLVVSYRASEPRADGGIGVMMNPGQADNAFARDGGDYLEIQLLPGRSGDLYRIGNFQAKVDGKDLAFAHPRREEVEERFNQWHEMRVEVWDGEVKVYLNGVLVNEAVGQVASGRIVLREERSKLEFRQVTLLPVSR
ncbi:MAG: hypothetical protein CMP28_02620 [Roseibacillus sp.]|nr:hypothetical protein [Roseibacillus sp.]